MFSLLFGTAFAASLSPGDAVAAALSSNPSLAEAKAEYEAARGAVRSSAFLRENPEIDGGYALLGDRVSASISQSISISGEGMNANASAKARFAAAEAALERAKLHVSAETRSAYVAAVVAHRAAALAGSSFELATRQLAATEAKVGVGESSTLDLHLARLEQAKAARELLASGAEEATALAEIGALVGRPIDGNDLANDPLDAAPTPKKGAAQERGDVRSARLAVAAAEAALRSQRSAVVPPLRFGGFYEAGSGEVVAGPSLGLTFPLWQQNQAGVAEARGQVGVAEAVLTATDARAKSEQISASNAAILADTTMAAVSATDDDGVAALRAIEAGVTSGELDLLTTVLLREQVIEGQLALIQAQGDLSLSRISLLLATEDSALLGGGTQ